MGFKVFSEVNEIKGFLDPLEGEALYEYASKFVFNKPALEIGSYCGKSSVYLGSAVKKNNQKLYSVDHHKGSEEQQPGEEYFDSDLLSDDGNCIDTLPHFLKTIRDFKLEGFVIPVISTSKEANTPSITFCSNFFTSVVSLLGTPAILPIFLCTLFL